MKIAGKGSGAERRDRERRLGRVDLAAERVAAYGDVDQVERRLLEPGDVVRRDDHPHAGAP